GERCRARGPVGVAGLSLGPAGHPPAVAYAEQQGTLRAIDVFVHLATGVDDKRPGFDRNRLARGPHRSATLEAEIDLGRVGVAVIGACLARLPAGDRNIPFARRAEYLLHMLLGIERLLGFEVESVHLRLRGPRPSL